MVRIGKSHDTVGWRPENAYVNMSGAISALGANNIDGVLAANDSLAGAVVSAFGAGGVSPPPPVTGQDADLVAVQRIVRGDQYMDRCRIRRARGPSPRWCEQVPEATTLPSVEALRPDHHTGCGRALRARVTPGRNHLRAPLCGR